MVVAEGGRFSSYALSKGEAMSMLTVNLLALPAIAGLLRRWWQAELPGAILWGIEARGFSVAASRRDGHVSGRAPRPSMAWPLFPADNERSTAAIPWRSN
jgi:hypothetical protein